MIKFEAVLVKTGLVQAWKTGWPQLLVALQSVFLLCDSVELEVGRLHWLEPRLLYRAAASDHWCLGGVSCSATVPADSAASRFYHVYSPIKQLCMSEL